MSSAAVLRLLDELQVLAREGSAWPAHVLVQVSRVLQIPLADCSRILSCDDCDDPRPPVYVDLGMAGNYVRRTSSSSPLEGWLLPQVDLLVAR